jgi:hypothetical protein
MGADQPSLRVLCEVPGPVNAFRDRGFLVTTIIA